MNSGNGIIRRRLALRQRMKRRSSSSSCENGASTGLGMNSRFMIPVTAKGFDGGHSLLSIPVSSAARNGWTVGLASICDESHPPSTGRNPACGQGCPLADHPWLLLHVRPALPPDGSEHCVKWRSTVQTPYPATAPWCTDWSEGMPPAECRSRRRHVRRPPCTHGRRTPR